MDTDQAETIVEEGVGADVIERLERMKSEQAPAQERASAQEQEPADDAVSFDDFADKKFKLSIKGEERTYSANDIKAMLGRASVNQKKLDETIKSDEYKLGLLISQARSGDKSAQKQVHKMLMESAGVKDPDSLTDHIEGIDGDGADPDKLLSERLKKAADDEVFDDVKDLVDFQDTLDKIPTLKTRMPEKVFNAFLSDPQSKRVLFNLIHSGRQDSLLDAFDKALGEMPVNEQIKIEADPDLWSQAFLTVVKRENARKAQKPVAQKENAIDAVSTGSATRNKSASGSGVPDFLNMSQEDFAKYMAKLERDGQI